MAEKVGGHDAKEHVIHAKVSWWRNIFAWLPPFNLFSLKLVNFSSEDSESLSGVFSNFAANLLSIITVMPLPLAWYQFLRQEDTSKTQEKLSKEPLVARKLTIAAEAYRDASRAVLGNSGFATLLRAIFGLVFMLVAYVTLPLWAGFSKDPLKFTDGKANAKKGREMTGVTSPAAGKKSGYAPFAAPGPVDIRSGVRISAAGGRKAPPAVEGSDDEEQPDAIARPSTPSGGGAGPKMFDRDEAGSIRSSRTPLADHPQLPFQVKPFPYETQRLPDDLSAMLSRDAGNHAVRQHLRGSVAALVTHAVDTFLSSQKFDPNNALHVLVLPTGQGAAAGGDNRSIWVQELQYRLPALVKSLPQMLGDFHERTAIVMPFLDCAHWVLMVYVVHQNRIIFINTLHNGLLPDHNRREGIIDPLLATMSGLAGGDTSYSLYGGDAEVGFQQDDERCGDWIAAYTYAILGYLNDSPGGKGDIRQAALLPWLYEYTTKVAAKVPVDQFLTDDERVEFATAVSDINNRELHESELKRLQKGMGLERPPIFGRHDPKIDAFQEAMLKSHLQILARWREGSWQQSPYVQWLKGQFHNVIVEINKSLDGGQVTDNVVRHFGNIYQELALLVSHVFPSDIDFFPPFFGPTAAEGGFACSMVSGLEQWGKQGSLMNENGRGVHHDLVSIVDACSEWCGEHQPDWKAAFNAVLDAPDNATAHVRLNKLLGLLGDNREEAAKLNVDTMMHRLVTILTTLLEGNPELGVSGPFAGDVGLESLKQTIVRLSELSNDAAAAPAP